MYTHQDADDDSALFKTISHCVQRKQFLFYFFENIFFILHNNATDTFYNFMYTIKAVGCRPTTTKEIHEI